MQITMWVPYDERRLRRTIAVVMRPQVRRMRIMGGILLALGALLIATGGPLELIVMTLVLGVLIATVIGPLTASRAVRMQSHVIKDGFQMTLTDEWVGVVYPLVESRYRWAGVDSVVETPDAWYMMLGKVQSLTIPKDTMTDEQRAEFAAFLVAEQQRQAGRAFLGRPR
ncbi:YcxB family protein [Dactylosporangium sp. NPDC049742]|uniref:YcxB family protein n=1 Tax=Dactylosporangium sp. NPDC049742 TaxID=3154737 RepID=UPI0034334578